MDPIYACCSALEDVGGPYASVQECGEALAATRLEPAPLSHLLIAYAVILTLAIVLHRLLPPR
jgi:hypothetical protein